MKLAVFGGAGFIGSHFVDKAIASKKYSQILIVDSLTYAGNKANIDVALRNPQTNFIKVMNMQRKFKILMSLLTLQQSHTWIDQSTVHLYLHKRIPWAPLFLRIPA